MASFVVRLAELLPSVRSEIEGARTAGGFDVSLLDQMVAHHFGFLGASVRASIVGYANSADEALILEFVPNASRDATDAERRFKRATDQADAGQLKRASAELISLTEEFPEVARYHRALGQAYLVAQDYSRAEDELLRSLALDASDADALTLLGNVYTKQQRPAHAVPLYERSLSIEKNVYAMNNLGAAFAQLGDLPRALTTLRAASEVDPSYPNTWFGLALTLAKQENVAVLPEALAALDTCFRVTGERRKSPEVWDAARGLLEELSRIEAREEVRAAQEAAQRIVADQVSAGGPSIRIEEATLQGVLAKLETAWVHGRSYHRLIVGPEPGPDRDHHVLHELQHILLMEAARAAGRNRWFGSTAAGREKALRSMADDILRIDQKGFVGGQGGSFIAMVLDGLLGQLFNFPLDLLIESRLLATYPQCRELFYQSIKAQLEQSVAIAQNRQIREATPKKIFRANTAMNGAFALWFENHFPLRNDLVKAFQQTAVWPVSKRLFALWERGNATWTAGSEYDWVDAWANELGLTGWYEWVDGNPRVADITPSR